MFKRKSNKQSNGFAVVNNSDVPRIAIKADGLVAFANEEFKALMDIQVERIKNKPFTEIFSIHTDNFEAIKDGVYEVTNKSLKTSKLFYFEWLGFGDGRRYLVGSIKEDGQNTRITKTDEQVKNRMRADLEREDIEENAGITENNAFTSDAAKKTPLLDKDVDHALNSDDNLGALAEMSNDFMIVMERDGTLLQTNMAFKKLFVVKNIKPENFSEIFPESERAFIRTQMHKTTLQSNNTKSADKINSENNPANMNDEFIFEARVKTQNNETMLIRWRQREEQGRIFCIGRNITAISDKQKALAEREEQLLEAESIAHMGNWTWIVGKDEIQWSDEIYQIFGVDKKFQPTLHNMGGLVNRRDMGRVNQAFQRAIIENNNYDMEFRILRPDGETRYIRCEGRCKLDHEGDVIALYGIMQDMTERVLYEEQLKQAKDTAERAYAAKTQFLANMSHELRTPLNAIIGFSEMMRTEMLGPLGNKKYVEYVSGIHESGEHLLDLISDILDMSKIEAGKYELDFENVDLRRTLKMAITMVESRAVEGRVTLDSQCLIDLDATIIADRRAIMQITLNILSNAVKFTPEKGTVTINCQKRDNYILIKVSDTGIGIPANKLAQITRPFEQASSSYTRNKGGSGLGLAITKELVELHGGALVIDSVYGEGTTVTMRLPYNAYEAQKNKKKQ